MKRPLIILVLAMLAVLAPAAPAAAAPPPELRCETYGCWYGHHPTHYERGGGEIRYALSYENLPDGPDGRFLDHVRFPQHYQSHRRAMWDQVAYCESTWRWHFVGRYHGGLQFHPTTWSAYGGGEFAAQAYNATPEQQIAVAERVLWAGYGNHGPQGRGAWPHCGRSLRHP